MAERFRPMDGGAGRLSMFAPPIKTAVLATVLLGCATAKTASEAELTRTVTALRAQNTAYARQIEELENRVFVLSAELDSRRAADPARPAEPQPTAAPVLPETKLQPGRETPQPDAAEPPASLVDETVVEYAGAAAEPRAGKRPLLRLWGPGSAEEGPAVEVAPERPTPAAVVPVAVRGERGASGEEPAERAPGPAAHGREGSEMALYQSANQHLRAGATGEAVAAFRAFVKRYPHHELADNAQYWLGECFYHRKDYSTALREFRRVVEKFPRGNKVPDALLKLGFSYLALGSTRPGRETLSELARTSPQHPASGLASAKLAELGTDQPEDRGGNKEAR
jgi:tol-pal system protein YbgF